MESMQRASQALRVAGQAQPRGRYSAPAPPAQSHLRAATLELWSDSNVAHARLLKLKPNALYQSFRAAAAQRRPLTVEVAQERPPGERLAAGVMCRGLEQMPPLGAQLSAAVLQRSAAAPARHPRAPTKRARSPSNRRALQL